jgi:type I restriction enzyme, S subunit
MKFEKLGNIADIIAGQSPPSSTYNSEGKGIPFFQGKADYGEKYPSVRYWCTEPTKISLPDDILISMRAPVGPVNINIVKSCIGRGLSAIRVKKNVSRDFIYFWLKQNQHIIAAKETGSTFKAITQKILNEIVVPFPSYPDQLHIANLLSKAENLIAQRKESIRLLDEFLKSTFLEMFGEPSTNKKKFPKGKIGDVVTEVKYGTSSPAEDEGLYPYLRMNNITPNGYMDYSKLKYINIADEKEKEKYVVRKGDLLFNRTNSKELVGKTGVFNEDSEMIIAGYLIRVRTNEKANPWFLWGYLNSIHGKQTLLGMCKSIVGMANINAQELQGIKILIPPIELQTQFAQIVEKTETLKTQYQQSLQELEHLYGSLSQKAFKGEVIHH